jgi:hypothetical protein
MLEADAAAIGSWHVAELAAERQPATVGTEAYVLSDLRVGIAGVHATMPTPV